MCLKESFFLDCWKILPVVLAFNNVGERSTVNIYKVNSRLSLGSKIPGKLVNNRLVDLLEKCVVFLISSIDLGFLE